MDADVYTWARTAAQALDLAEPAAWASERDTVTRVLDLTRDVAHGVNRPAAPMTSFLVGVAVGLAGATGPEQLAAACRSIEEALAAGAPES